MTHGFKLSEAKKESEETHEVVEFAEVEVNEEEVECRTERRDAI